MKFSDWLKNRIMLEYSQESLRRLIYSYGSRKGGTNLMPPGYGIVAPGIGSALFAGIKPPEFDITPVTDFLKQRGEKQEMMDSITLPLQLPRIEGKEIGIKSQVYSKTIVNDIMKNLDEITKRVRHQNQMGEDKTKFDLPSESLSERQSAKNFTLALGVVILWANNINDQYNYDLLNPDINGLRETNGQLSFQVSYRPLTSRSTK